MATRGTSTKAAARVKTPKTVAQPAPPAVVDAAVVKASKADKARRKLVRDSFTIPKDEYVALADLKQHAAHLARPTKKSEILRAGIRALSAMDDERFLAALGAVPSLKAGRPKRRGASAAKAAAKNA